MSVVIGTAGWSIPTKEAASFGKEGSALQRYASRFGGVEINSSFHRPHRSSTWARWADSVPAGFRFAVKIPKAITHERRLSDCTGAVTEFLEQVCALGPKLSIFLVQLPPKLVFESTVAADFFKILSSLTNVRAVCEPRHMSWFGVEAENMFQDLKVARVAADPALVPAAARPGGWRGLSYWRLHGSPAMYRSPYGADRLEGYARLIREDRQSRREVWCMFDNTASTAAIADALSLSERVTADCD